MGRRIPIIGDDYADPEKGTGAVKITPAHDFNDFEVGRRHGLPLVNMLDIEGRLDLNDNAEFLEGLPLSAALQETLALHGLDRFAARKKIVERLDAAGLLDKIEPTIHTVPHGDRSGAVLEPFLTDQWYVDAKTLAQPAITAVREGKTSFVPSQWQATFFNWMENIQPWCISRQIWWGHQIPAWYGPDGKVFVAENEDDAVAKRSPTTPTSKRSRSRTATTSPPIRSGARALPTNICIATKTCSIPGSPRRCGRSRRSAGPTRRRS